MATPESCYFCIEVYKGVMECDHLKALDLAREGGWNESHKLVQKYSDNLSCLIHAYLHRVEGNMSNAKYWYRRAGVDMPNNKLEDELKRLYEMTDRPKTPTGTSGGP